ncbi:helix-turn-helix domain-containing protein [Wenjunlia tyrosinilytica]|uniref:HTH cro/C1-type domain-containing protein n=1 Tax=Wenjunlia tyrosinilytica TaxID=1544741 RepID=A0A918DUQ2_9ACTN|nr:helix-turn-helix transcriptional regulator [Wenjunlia tyrosinilytica]GGO84846.1 hypothetical protein GCM10012280_17260 [Wenjunlia tyrosinilytica]
MSNHTPNQTRVTPPAPAQAPARPPVPAAVPAAASPAPAAAPAAKEPLWRHIVGDVLRRERLAQERTLKDVAEAGRISMPYLSELERGRKEASSEVLAAAAHALGLGLADLLALAQGELARLDEARSARSAPSTRSVVRKRTSPASVTRLSTRLGGAPVASRQGEVRLAA